MIGKLTGILDYRASDHVMLDVRGVGYLVYCSDRTLAALPGPGEAVALYTDLVVREDLLQLFGFTSLVEKEWHRLLVSVQGVGAKASLAILGALGPDGVGRAIALGDWNAVRAAKGIGPKIAQRVVLDLKDKAPGIMAMPHADLTVKATRAEADGGEVVLVETPGAARPEADPSAQADALSALSNLGYAPGDAAAAIAATLAEKPAGSTADLIRSALRRLAPKE